MMGGIPIRAGGNELKLCHRLRPGQDFQLGRPRRGRPAKAGPLWSSRSTKPIRSCVPDVGPRCALLPSSSGIRPRSSKRFSGIAGCGKSVDRHRRQSRRRAEDSQEAARPEPNLRGGGQAGLSAWDQNSALPPAVPALAGVRIVPVRTSAVSMGKILLSTWDRSASGRDFVLSKHPWHTTLSAAQKRKFLSVKKNIEPSQAEFFSPVLSSTRSPFSTCFPHSVTPPCWAMKREGRAGAHCFLTCCKKKQRFVQSASP
jgi:hypothetical protein